MFASTKARIINFVVATNPQTLALGIFAAIVCGIPAILTLVF